MKQVNQLCRSFLPIPLASKLHRASFSITETVQSYQHASTSGMIHHLGASLNEQHTAGFVVAHSRISKLAHK